MTEISQADLTYWLGYFWWPFIRVTGFFLVAPIFGDKSISLKFRLYVALIAATLLMPFQVGNKPFNPFVIDTAFLTAIELFIGFLLGFAFSIFITIFTQAGQMISMQMGLAMAMMNDPKNGISNSIISRIFLIGSILMFLALDGHILMLSVLKNSYDVWPTGSLPNNQKLSDYLQLFSWLFIQSLILAMPAIAIMLTSNITFGTLSKLAPSLNIFALGFPLTIVMGIAALTLSFFNLGDAFINASNILNDFLNKQFEQ
ncbi:flagellar biosynthetic protein FliR [Vibrio owensii]|uniref:flagellar biosynthetic protein FliR n=1 Tax=Vibrio owensii TaxID=696485 RepID=UPI0018F1774D|nr:flagellar biosynthetic protein FliR [Vibrio owensii]